MSLKREAFELKQYRLSKEETIATLGKSLLALLLDLPIKLALYPVQPNKKPLRRDDASCRPPPHLET